MTDLKEAFLDAPDVRPDLAAAVMVRVRARDRRRLAVILASAGAGTGLALAALSATGALQPHVLSRLAELALSPWPIAALGLTLTAFAWRETVAEL